MTQILNIVLNTPWWAFALFAVLVLFGVQALRPRTVPIWRLLVTPALFIGWGVISLALQSSSSPVLVLDWLITATAGGVLAWITNRNDEVAIERTGVVTMPGSALPLVRNLLIFAAKYGLAVAVALNLALRQDLAPWDIAVSGASAGYFLGWLAQLGLAYRRAAGGEAATPTQF